jgi:hypothetical protein
LLIIIGGVLAWQTAEEDTPEPTKDAVVAGGTVPPGESEEAVADVADRFVEALSTGDYETLYQLQTEGYRQRCSLEEFTAFAEQLGVTTLRGPARIAIQGDEAAVRVYTGVEGAETPVVLPLVREQDGSWRVVAQAVQGCGAPAR